MGTPVFNSLECSNYIFLSNKIVYILMLYFNYYRKTVRSWNLIIWALRVLLLLEEYKKMNYSIRRNHYESFYKNN